MIQYLTEEEQYKKILNQEEIKRIKAPELRSIRVKFWRKRHAATLDERDIPDSRIMLVYRNLLDEEAKEIEEYKKRKEKRERGGREERKRGREKGMEERKKRERERSF